MTVIQLSNSILFNILLFIFGYIAGSLNTSIIWGKIVKKDVRELHSKNAGATNSSRVLGKKAGLCILLIDVFKTILMVSIAYGLCKVINKNNLNMSLYVFPILCGLGVVVGHCFPIFFKFKGGKGVATSIGLLISINIALLPIAAVIFFAVLFWKKYVSLASIVSALLMMPVIMFAHWFLSSDLSWATNMKWLADYSQHTTRSLYNYQLTSGIFFIAAALLIVIMHRDNLVRIFKNQERKLSFLDRSNKK
ncbi:glycerol-3-phosphate 1-O-acyltransferase PlsY [Mycoplasma sp. 2045]|uniref:glycerol-3-phosphate 1-O-acyltransferase PlsY n=1 Tax=Mycoplasma sp. 2045 TaxID=2967301 RepID=UPI00211C3965|nr:glycerol-3-phosphate 1-O-acyltransferase PlsY [Mycoplasma sp. 2045]UUM20434.1 glycerol-3-phosphate 1-O-acyltransferase PlsY [Mycoplasma sp. 2045]